MVTFLYWVGIFIITFAALSAWKLNQYEEDELLLSKEEIFRIVMILTIIGAIILSIIMPFKNYQMKQERELNFNRTFIK